jgi:hypothetical protein
MNNMNDPYQNDATYLSLHSQSDIIDAMRSRIATIRKWIVIVWVLIVAIAAIVFLITGVPIAYLALVAGIFVLTAWGIHLAVVWHQRNRALYQSVLPMLLGRIEQEQGFSLRYEYRPSLDKSFNERMGLFTRYASISAQYEMVLSTEEDIDITLSQVSMTTSNGKSATTHFSGVYVMFPVAGYPAQQLRTSGSPAWKQHKFTRLKEEEDRMFVLEDHPDERIDSTLRQVKQSAQDQFELRGAYLASNGEEVHLGLWFKKIPSLPKEWNEATLRPILEWYKELLLFVQSTYEQLEMTR